MTRFIAHRALHSIFALLGLLIVVFFLTRMIGDPASLFLPETATQADREAFARANGYDGPVILQFFNYIGGMVQGEFGNSLRQQRPAMDVVIGAIPTTATLAGSALLIALTVSILLGSLAANRPNGLFDRIASNVSLIGASAPDFWVAIVLVLVLALQLGWLPTSGVGGLQYWVMPVAVVALRPTAILVQVVRGAMIEALSSPFVKTARAKGLEQRIILFHHALRAALLPVITVAGDLAVGMVNGSIIVETVFGLNGLGRTLTDAILQRDFAVVQAAVLVVAVAIFIVNILIDILYSVVDPRIRHS